MNTRTDFYFSDSFFYNFGDVIYLVSFQNVKTYVFYRMEKETELKKAFQYIQAGALEDALRIISENLLRESIMLMASINKGQTKYELYSLFYENFMDFADKVQEGKFTYASDAALKSFFKTGCTHKAKEQHRMFTKSKDWLEISFFENHSDDFDESFEDCKKEEYDVVLEKYGVDLNSVDSTDEVPINVITAFHELNEKCKFLVVLKYMLSLSHKDIVDCLSNFYELKNENVSKVELKRCLDNLKKQTANTLIQ